MIAHTGARHVRTNKEWGKPFQYFGDDGVKTNYLKLGEALSPIPGLSAAEDE